MCESYKQRQNQGIKEGEIKPTFKKRETKKMKGLGEAEELRGEGKDFKARERNYREKKERGGGISDGREMAGYRNG